MLGRFISLGLASGLIIAGFSIWQLTIIFWVPIALIVALNLFNLITFQKIKPIDNFIQKQNVFIKNKFDYLQPFVAYIFLLRVPLISSLLIVVVPLIANFNRGASRFAQNIFAMRSNIQVFLVMIAAAVTSLVIISLGKTILELYFQSENNRWGWRILSFIILVTPTWLAIHWNSYPKLDMNREANISKGSFWLGLTIGILIFMVAAWLDSQESNINRNKLFNYFYQEELPKRRNTFFKIQAIVGIIFYAIVIALYQPDAKQDAISEFPALLYLFLIIWIATLLFGRLTYFFDKSFDNQNSSFRFPILISTFMFMGFSYFAWQVEHYFKLIPITNQTEEVSDYKTAFKTAIKQRLGNTDAEKTMVVVAASGGGIQASGWTTQVLAGLQQEAELGEDFTQAISLISSTSGGSVGTMFYLDQFKNGVLSEEGLQKNEDELETVVANSTDDWLDAVGWGLAFPDLFRVTGFPFTSIWQKYKYLDRGYSLEKDWQKGFKDPETEVTLETWHRKILEGEIPIPVFNSTLVENGRRFLISPMKFIPGQMKDYINQKDEIEKTKALDFKTLYADACDEEGKQQVCDLNVTTAARLSASFPFVSPVARNDRDNKITIIDDNQEKTEKIVFQNYHMADGGYFDNYGIYTAIEWLDEFLDSSREELNLKKVLLIQINAFPISQLKQEERGDRGIGGAILAPLQTLNGVRDSTQLERNLTEVELLKKRWNERKESPKGLAPNALKDTASHIASDRIQIKYVELSFPKEIEGEVYEPPLSWRLSKEEKNNLQRAWKEESIRTQVRAIKKFWQS